MLAASHNFPDALSGGSVAARLQAPLLLTDSGQLSQPTLAAIRRYSDPNDEGVPPVNTTIYIMGGEAAISNAVEADIRAQGFSVERVAGANRFETAVLATKIAETRITHYYVADGGTFQDAVVASNAAGDTGALLLTAGPDMPPETERFLGFPDVRGNATVIGESASVAAPDLPSIYGPDHYHTSVEVAKTLFPDYRAFALARGDEFADALAGTAHTGAYKIPDHLTDHPQESRGIPLLLVDRDSTPESVIEEIGREHRDVGFILGGENAISEDVNNQIGFVGVVGSCSIINLTQGSNCQLTLSRVATHHLCEELACHDGNAAANATVATIAAACGLLGGPIAGAVCGVGFGYPANTFFNDLRRASEDGKCFAVRHYFIYGDPRALTNPTVIAEDELCDRASRTDGQ